jgi:hypothetical protein
MTAPRATRRQTVSTPREIDAFLTAYVENWNGEGDRLGEIFHPSGTLAGPGQEKPWSVAETARFIASVKAGVPDLRIRILEWAHRGDQLFTEWEMAGTLAGQPLAWRGINRNRLRGTASLAAVSYWDRLGLLEQAEPGRPRLDLFSELARLQRPG